MKYFTADTHFRHINCLNYGRNKFFSSIEEHDNELIRRWNEIVKVDDELWFLGDFIFGKAKHYLPRLQGQLHLIIGNHDHKELRNNSRWLSVNHYCELKDNNFGLIVLCHYPFESWNKHSYGSLHVHGHSHGNLLPRGRRIDVGVDCFNFTPVSLEQLKLHPQLKVSPHQVDHHILKDGEK
jgi:calcineurin-like phosphoesterase family protein